MIRIACLGLLFDCDGVLVDSTASGERAWTRWAGEYGLSPDQVLAGVHGRRSVETVTRFLPEHQRASAVARIDELEIADAPGVRPIAGAARLVRTLPADRWAVVTSATAALVRARLAAAAIPEPSVLITADDVSIGKPAPDPYLAAAAALGLSTPDTIVLEDTVGGVRSARAAGAGLVIGVGPRALDSDADPVIRDLRDLTWSTQDGTLNIPPSALLR